MTLQREVREYKQYEDKVKELEAQLSQTQKEKKLLEVDNKNLKEIISPDQQSNQNMNQTV